jgi:phosphopantothenoylcysteine decarboxylase/phosphopantothenate--cysteine ligase
MPRLLLGICGGIAAYKAAELARLLIKAGAEVRVVMTANACQFITPLTLQAITHYPVATQLLNTESEAAMPHIELARWPEQIIIAPASANTLANISYGFANDLLSTLCLASNAPIIVAPAMNQAMWLNPATQDNMARLKNRGVRIIEPDSGIQACGEIGPGRLAEPEHIAHFCLSQFTEKKLTAQKWVITAGPTREAIDPVRYLSNHSSGKMGYALAAAAQQAGAEVVLISGPTALPTPLGVQRIDVINAQQMLEACLQHAAHCDVFVGAAAVADYTLAAAPQKIKKTAASMTLSLIPTQDILLQVRKHCQPRLMVGFAAETQNIIEQARAKLQRKQLDLLIANDVSQPHYGFNHDHNQVILLDPDHTTPLPLMSKTQLAPQLIAWIDQHQKAQGRKIT